MENTVKERLNSFIKSQNIGQSKFEKKVGLSNGYVNNISKSIGAEKLQRILNIYPELNENWLLTGEGEMLKQNNSVHTENRIPLISTYARGGRFDDFDIQIKKNECELVISPIKNAEYAITIFGDSMEPEFPNGSQLHIMKVNENAFLEWGKTYVLDTCNGTVVKKIYKTKDKNVIRCSSINKEYEDFTVKTEDIYGFYRVLACLTFK